MEGGGLCFYAALKTMLETEVAGVGAMFDSPRSLRAAVLGVFDDDAMLDLPWTDDAARGCTVRDCLESFATARPCTPHTLMPHMRCKYHTNTTIK